MSYRSKRTKTHKSAAQFRETAVIGNQVREEMPNSVSHPNKTHNSVSEVRESTSNSAAHSTSYTDTQVKEKVSNSISQPNHTQIRKGARSADVNLGHPPTTLDKEGSTSAKIQSAQTSNGKGKRPIHVQSASAPVNTSNIRLDVSGRETSNEMLEEGTGPAKESKSKSSRLRSVKSRNVAPTWPELIDFDEKEEVLTIDAEGKHMLLSGPIQPRDIDNLTVGIKIFVHFNHLNQPVYRGGSILAKYLGNLAKNKRFCPIGEKSWDEVNDHLKADIIQVVRSRFVIPEDAWIFDQAILIRVGKHWRQYKHSLKREKFNPLVRTREQIYNDVPNGQERNNWMHLVDHWYSEESKKLSEHGKLARAAQSHVHTTGATSYAEKRAEFVKSNGRQPSHLEFFKMTHCRSDGTYVNNTLTSEFLMEVNSKVKELAQSSSKSELEIQNEVFDSLMYEEGKPKKPIGFGLGVKESDVFGVKSMVRKTDSSAAGMNNCIEIETLKSTISKMKEDNQRELAAMKEENHVALAHVKKQNEELQARVEQTNQLLLQALISMRTGTVTNEFLDAAESALNLSDSHMASTTGES